MDNKNKLDKSVNKIEVTCKSYCSNLYISLGSSPSIIQDNKRNDNTQTFILEYIKATNNFVIKPKTQQDKYIGVVPHVSNPDGLVNVVTSININEAPKWKLQYIEHSDTHRILLDDDNNKGISIPNASLKPGNVLNIWPRVSEKFGNDLWIIDIL